jgi:hypothetical protein
MVVWVAMSTGWLVGFTDGDSALFIKGFRDKFFPQVRRVDIMQTCSAAAMQLQHKWLGV